MHVNVGLVPSVMTKIRMSISFVYILLSTLSQRSIQNLFLDVFFHRIILASHLQHPVYDSPQKMKHCKQYFSLIPRPFNFFNIYNMYDIFCISKLKLFQIVYLDFIISDMIRYWIEVLPTQKVFLRKNLRLSKYPQQIVCAMSCNQSF